MEHSRETTSAAFGTEPGDGTILVIKKSDPVYNNSEWEVIWRDNAEARRWHDGDNPGGQHWFRAADEDPMELHQYLKYADSVYSLGQKIADFGGDED